MDVDDDLSPTQLEWIRRFIEVTDIDADAVSDDFRELVETHWP